MRPNLILSLWCAFAWETAAAAEGPYRFLNEIAIGGEGGWDILEADTAAVIARPKCLIFPRFEVSVSDN